MFSKVITGGVALSGKLRKFANKKSVLNNILIMIIIPGLALKDVQVITCMLHNNKVSGILFPMSICLKENLANHCQFTKFYFSVTNINSDPNNPDHGCFKAV